MANNNNRKRRPNTFDRMINEYGENGIESIRADRMQKYAVGILRDIAHGSINYEEQGLFFMNEMVLSALNFVVTTKLEKQNIIKMAMDNFMGSEAMNQIPVTEHAKINVVWQKTNELHYILNVLKTAVLYTEANRGDTTMLYSVPVSLSNCRGSIADL